jgi:hypothetical protein
MAQWYHNNFMQNTAEAFPLAAHQKKKIIKNLQT